MTTRFRALPLREQPQQVDRDARVIYGVSCAQAVEALGHGLMLDSISIGQIVTLGNAAKRGIKSRFTHPGLSSDGLGKYLGRLKNFRQEQDKALADLHLSDVASKSPDGDLGSYVLDLAEDEPDAFGMSVVIDLEKVWPLADGREVPVDYDEGGRPADATTKIPVARITNLLACDTVDEPAANRDGLFSAQHLWASNAIAQDAFNDIDEYLASVNVTPGKAFEVALKYFNARGVDLKEFAKMSENKKEQPVNEPAIGQLQEQLNAMQAALAAKEAEAAEAKQRMESLTATLDASNKRIADMEQAARTARFRAMAAEWAGDTAGHVAVLEALEEGGVAFAAYVTNQKALTEQVKTGALFSEAGHDKSDGGASAENRLMSMAKMLQADDGGLTFAQALDLAAQQNPALYREYVEEMRG